MKTVTIYTDGACSGNPGPGGWGANSPRKATPSAGTPFDFKYRRSEMNSASAPRHSARAIALRMAPKEVI